MTIRPARGLLFVAALGACGTDGSPELVVASAGASAGPVAVVGATPDAVFWTAGDAPTSAAGSSLAKLPGAAEPFGTATGAVQVGDHLLYANGAALVRAIPGEPVDRLLRATDVDAVGETTDAPPLYVWASGRTLSWGAEGATEPAGTATLPKTSRFSAIRATAHAFYVASPDRVYRVDRSTGASALLASTTDLAASFPPGAPAGAKYAGHLVAADDASVLYLVTEAPSQRAILVSVPATGEPAVLQSHITGASALFVTDDAVYWQESDALLTAPRTGGTASIAAHVANAGAVADGYVYYVDGDAIMRAPVD